MKKMILTACSLFTLLCVQAATKDFNTEYATLDSLNNLSRLVYKGSVTPNWKDNNSFTFETQEAEGKKYYKVDLTTRQKVAISKDSATASSSTSSGERRRERTENANRSFDGNWEAFVKDANVWVKNVKENKEYQLSFDGTSTDAYTACYWAPNSLKLATIKRLEVERHRIPLIESAPKNQIQPNLQWRDYYKPGDVMPIERPALFDVETRQQISFDTKPYEQQYALRFGKWLEDGSGFTFEYNQRGHQRYQIVKVDAQTGNCFPFIDEQSKTFIYYNRNYMHYLKGDKEAIWASERDGWRHLYLIDIASGKVKQQLTKGEWVVRNVIELNETDGYMIIQGSGKVAGEDPYNIHYYRLELKNGTLVDLTPENGNHIVSFSPDKKTFVDNYSRPDAPSVSLVKESKEGRKLMDIQSADISELKKKGWSMPEVFSAKGRDGKSDIWGVIYRPSNFKPGKSYPVVEYIYAGPHDSFVVKDFAAVQRFQRLLELGFIVVSIDGMGTANRSKAFHDVCWRNLKDAGFPDRILWMQAAAKKYKQMDLNRVGIYGYSAGGQSSLAALLFHGDFYKAAVALCGCHDNRMDKVWWNEQWMGYPVGPWYSENSNVDNAHLLKGKLLLVNGELDDNVDPTSTLQVVDALVKANKDFEQLYLPGYGHGLGDNYVTRRVFEFLTRQLRN